MQDQTALEAYLISEWKYTEHEAKMVTEDLLVSQPQIQQSFDLWQASGDLPTLEVEGYTVQQLAKEHGMNPMAALLTLDWLLTDPESAKSAIAEGYDQLV